MVRQHPTGEKEGNKTEIRKLTSPSPTRESRSQNGLGDERGYERVQDEGSRGQALNEASVLQGGDIGYDDGGEDL